MILLNLHFSRNRSKLCKVPHILHLSLLSYLDLICHIFNFMSHKMCLNTNFYCFHIKYGFQRFLGKKWPLNSNFKSFLKKIRLIQYLKIICKQKLLGRNEITLLFFNTKTLRVP